MAGKHGGARELFRISSGGSSNSKRKSRSDAGGSTCNFCSSWGEFCPIGASSKLRQKKMLKTVAAVTKKLVSKAAAAGAMKMAAAAAVAKIHIVLGWVHGHIRCLNVCALKSNCGRRD
jgi:hypothetical protein